MRAYKIGLINNVKTSTPVCQACMGKWTGDLAAAFGASPFDVDGLCGHELSITSAGGFYVAGTDPNNPLLVDWDDDEVRWFGIKQTSKMTASNGLVGGICPAVVLGVSGNVFLMNKGTYDGSKTKVMFTLADSQFALIEDTGTIELSGQIDEYYLGVGGDGTLYGMAGNTIYKLSTKQPNEALILGGVILPTAPVDFDPPWSGTAKAEVLTDVDDLSVFENTKIAFDAEAYSTMCGELLPSPRFKKCDLPMKSDVAIISGDNDQIITMPVVNVQNQSFPSQPLFKEIVSNTDAGILKGFQIDILENQSVISVDFFYGEGLNDRVLFKIKRNGANWDVEWYMGAGLSVSTSVTSFFVGVQGYEDPNGGFLYLLYTEGGVDKAEMLNFFPYTEIVNFEVSLVNKTIGTLSPPSKIEIVSKPNEIMPLTLPSGITEIQAWCGEKIL